MSSDSWRNIHQPRQVMALVLPTVMTVAMLLLLILPVVTASISVNSKYTSRGGSIADLVRLPSSLGSLVVVGERRRSQQASQTAAQQMSIFARDADDRNVKPLSLLEIRGGASGNKDSRTTTKKKKTTTKTTKKKTQGASKIETTEEAEEKGQINEALKEKDAAEALGDAIRERADQLRSEAAATTAASGSPKMHRSVASMGWALGASDQMMGITAADINDNDGGGVEASVTSVLVHYFLKSHGGAHALQCACSLLATVAGLGSVLLLQNNHGQLQNNVLSLTLMKRCLLFAMVKHVSGLLAATVLTAKAIPTVGLSQARAWIEDLVKDPISQYVFYTACVLLWLPKNHPFSIAIGQQQPQPPTGQSTTATTTATAATSSLWWQSYRIFPASLVGPVVLRELISTLLVLSDILILLASCTTATSDDKTLAHRILAAGRNVSDALMSLLVTPTVWRKTLTSAAERQVLLAKLTSRVSLALEVIVGALMVLDTAMAVIGFLFISSSSSSSSPQSSSPLLRFVRPVSFSSLCKNLFCTRLYVHYLLWTRRRKITQLAHSMRGGALQLPLYLLQIIAEPMASMGLDDVCQQESSKSASSVLSPTTLNRKNGDDNDNTNHQTPVVFSSWRDYLRVVLGLDEDKVIA